MSNAKTSAFQQELGLTEPCFVVVEPLLTSVSPTRSQFQRELLQQSWSARGPFNVSRLKSVLKKLTTKHPAFQPPKIEAAVASQPQGR